MGSANDTYEIVKLIVEHGADVNAENERGETALYGAAFLGNDKAIQYLVDHGAKLDAKTKAGRTIYDGVLNTGIPDDGTGQRPGGKPGPATVELVRTLMVAAGVEPTSTTVARRESRYAPPRGAAAAADPNQANDQVPPEPAAPASAPAPSPR